MRARGQIVPESIRTSVYAFDRCITGAIGAAFTPLAGILAERVFGFKTAPHHAAGAAPPPATGVQKSVLPTLSARCTWEHPPRWIVFQLGNEHQLGVSHMPVHAAQVQRTRRTRPPSTRPTC